MLGDFLRTPNLGSHRHPLSRAFPALVIFRTTIHLPSEWPLDQEDRLIEHDAFTFAFRLKSTGRTVTLNYEWSSRQPEVPVAALPAFAAKSKEAMDLLGYQLTHNTAVAQAGFFPPKWPMVLLATAVVFLGFFAGWRLLRLKNPRPPDPPLLTAAAVDPYSYSGKVRREDSVFGGWLVLVGVNLMVRPCFLIYALQQGTSGYFNRATWDILTSPASDAYQPHYAMVASVELVLNLSLLLWNLILLLLFFRRSYVFPRGMQSLLGFHVLAAIFFAWSHTLITTSGVEAQTEAYRGVFQTIIAALIWIPYLQVSRRVKRTFTL